MVGAGYSAERRYCHDAQRTMDELAGLNLNTYSCEVPNFNSLSVETVTVSPGPAFNCEKASTDEEREICSSPHLSLLDRYMSGLYKLAVEEYPESAALIKADQKKWLERRGGYLLETYEWRIKQLQDEFKRKPPSY